LLPDSGQDAELYFCRVATSLKLGEEFRAAPPETQVPRRRASVVEIGSPLRGSFMRNYSKEVHTELPRWKSVAAGNPVQVLSRPDWLGRVERGIKVSRAKRDKAHATRMAATVSEGMGGSIGSPSSRSPSPTRSPARKATRTYSADGAPHEEDEAEDHEDEEKKEKRSRATERARARDAQEGAFDEAIKKLSASLPNLHDNEHLKHLKEFEDNTKTRARKSQYLRPRQSQALKRMSQTKIVSIEDEEKLDNFWTWCKETFGTLEKAFKAFDLNGNGQLSSVEFADGCRARGYPGNPTKYKRIFFLMDADLDGSIGKPEFSGSKVRRQSTLEAEEARKKLGIQRQTINVDPFAGIADGETRGSVLSMKRSLMVNEMRKQDPVVAQFVDFLFQGYETLKAAFRQIDINRNGLLSKSEFKDGLRILRIGKMSMQDLHLVDLFKRLDEDNSGHITVDEMISETADPMIQRLVKYLLDVRSDFHVKNEKKSNLTREQRLARVFSKIDDDMSSGIDCEEFVSALKRLRYLDWHVGELFDRLDKDRSGQLSVGEFTAFLEKDNLRKISKDRSGSKDLAGQGKDPAQEAIENFEAKFETNAFATVFSVKLQKIGTRSGHTADLLREANNPDAPPGGSNSVKKGIGGWVTDTTGGFAQVFQRDKDYVVECRKKMKERRPDMYDDNLVLHESPAKSTLRPGGSKSFGISLPSMNAAWNHNDGLPLCAGLEYVHHREKYEPFARSRVTF